MTAWMDDDLADLHRLGLHRVRRRIQSAAGVHVRYRQRDFLNFASNDYLNLAADPRLARAASGAARRYGCGAGASALVSGYLPPHRALERALAHWEGTEAALVFSSGFAANLAVVSSVVGREDAVFSDELNHASLIDGSRLSQARVHVYRHADANHLEDLLRREGGAARRRLIVSDSVFSMDGDLAPLADLLALAQRFDALLLIDEAHATGVLGADGRGLSATLDEPSQSARATGPNSGSLAGRASDGGPRGPKDGPTPPSLARPANEPEFGPAARSEALIKVGTLSKALGAQGGFVCGSRRLIDWLVNRARPYIFSTALAPPLAAAARRAVRIVQEEPERRAHLMALAEHLREQLRGLGYPESRSRCQIVPVIVGEVQAAVELSRRLEEQGLLVPAIRPPSVAEGTARLRISLTAGHTQEDLQHLVDSLSVSRRSTG